jgi:hypothetical protein
MSNGMTNTNRSMKNYLLKPVIMVLLILAFELCIITCIGSPGLSWNTVESGIITADHYASIPGKIFLKWM